MVLCFESLLTPHQKIHNNPHQVLAAILTLYQPGGVDYAHLIVIRGCQIGI